MANGMKPGGAAEMSAKMKHAAENLKAMELNPAVRAGLIQRITAAAAKAPVILLHQVAIALEAHQNDQEAVRK